MKAQNQCCTDDVLRAFIVEHEHVLNVDDGQRGEAMIWEWDSSSAGSPLPFVYLSE